MQKTIQKRWLAFWVCFLSAFLLVSVSFALNVDLIAYVTYSLKDSAGAPLSPGSVVMIFGSGDAVNDGPQSWGDSLIANSTQGDDVYLGFVRIDQPSYLGSNGTFYTANVISFDDAVINYLYIRFFDTNAYPVMGSNIPWGVSDVYGYTSQFGKAEVDFVGNYMTVLTNNFVIIPEPGTANLFFLFIGLVAGMHAAMKKSERKREQRCLR